VKRVSFNGEAKQLPDGIITYAQAADHAGVDPLYEPVVKYRHASGTSGVLSPGDRIVLSEGLAFEVKKP
jgi:hypothetical protein